MKTSAGVVGAFLEFWMLIPTVGIRTPGSNRMSGRLLHHRLQCYKSKVPAIPRKSESQTVNRSLWPLLHQEVPFAGWLGVPLLEGHHSSTPDGLLGCRKQGVRHFGAVPAQPPGTPGQSTVDFLEAPRIRNNYPEAHHCHCHVQ